MRSIDPKFGTLCKIAARHEKRVEKFQEAAQKLFHPRATILCNHIKKGIPEFRGCQLAMRHLYLYPTELQIKFIDQYGENGTDRLGNIMEYLERKDYTVRLNKQTCDALIELNELANYIDDNYSMVAGLYVNLTSAPL